MSTHGESDDAMARGEPGSDEQRTGTGDATASTETDDATAGAGGPTAAAGTGDTDAGTGDATAGVGADDANTGAESGDATAGAGGPTAGAGTGDTDAGTGDATAGVETDAGTASAGADDANAGAESGDARTADAERVADAAADRATPVTESPQDRRMAGKAARAEERERAVQERAAAEAEADTVHLRVFRYDPDVEAKAEPRFDDFHVPREPGLTVLEALIYARDEFDSSLTFRHSCRQAVCGSDAFFVNGRQRLGCKTQVADLDEPIRVEPLPHQDVVKDLVVDMEHFYDQMAAVEPYFQPTDLPEGELEEQRQSPENREKIKMATRCIWCGACTSSCNIVAGDERYLGPAAINAAYRFYVDEREGEAVREERLDVLDQEHGVWRCQTQFSCTEVCPKDIPLTEHIQALKREAVKNNLKFW